MNTDTQVLTARVQAALCDALRVPPEQVSPEMAFGDLPQWDSMGHMEVMMGLELHFGIEINPDTIAQLTSIPAICSYIEANSHG